MASLDLEAALNGPQLRAVRTLEGPVLIIAGAGSGKTRVITYRIANMLERGVPQHAILALTFTNKAAREMETRVKTLTGKKLSNLTISTFHAFGVQVLREEIERLGYRKNFSIYDETDRNEAIRESLRECRISTEGVDLFKIGQLFSDVKIGRRHWGGAGSDCAASEWEPVYKTYQHTLKVYNAVDFDDLLALPLTLFREAPDVLRKQHERYRYILVDEFQDTSLIQYRLLKTLAWGGEPPPSPPPPSPNVCVVGDDDQSIYSWRGASYENLSSFEKDFPGTVEIKLEQNYRSTNTILEAANGVISHNTNRKEKRLWSGQGTGKPIELFYPLDETDEANFIAEQIKRLRYEERLHYDAFGVLVRTNNQTTAIEEAFLAADIPYRVSGGMSFFGRKEIKDIVSYLRVIANPQDDVNLLRIINTPRRGIGKAAIERLGELSRKNRESLWTSLERFRLAADHGQALLMQEAKSGAADIDEFITLIENARESMRSRKNLAEKVRALVDGIDYWGHLVTEHSKNDKVARWKFGNIEMFLDMIDRWEKDPDTSETGLYAWLNRISLITRNDGEDDSQKGAVNLMTVHASKGLEFPVVCIAGAEDGIMPHRRTVADAEAAAEGGAPGANDGSVEEERRLFYVAITRARDKLLITSCQQRKRNRETIVSAPSPFLAEIPPRLVEYHEKAEASPEEDAAAGEAFFRRMREQLRSNSPPRPR
ncbi:MAG: exodeoxyribonuclease V subunit gamma [Treponema sp.]|jgi:DNA helicase-2/ATP-dependent DNA helicase PcrA|nr:exodeoxyribonuclease V subunit gamma [Treponema sp.]